MWRGTGTPARLTIRGTGGRCYALDAGLAPSDTGFVWPSFILHDSGVHASELGVLIESVSSGPSPKTVFVPAQAADGVAAFTLLLWPTREFNRLVATVTVDGESTPRMKRTPVSDLTILPYTAHALLLPGNLPHHRVIHVEIDGDAEGRLVALPVDLFIP